MAVSGYAFVVIKIGFALQRIAAQKRAGGEVTLSHAVPWARKAFDICAKLNSATTKEGKVFGRVTFPISLDSQAQANLQDISRNSLEGNQ
eukprot:IDg6196t1